MHCERKRSVFVKRVSDLGVTEMKRVLFVTSEAVPFIKTGGLADVAGSLPKYFSKNEYEVSVMLPKYMCIREDMRKKMHHILHFYVDLLFQSTCALSRNGGTRCSMWTISIWTT